MAPNVTIYCLENVTDYFEFERLCHDLMIRSGYSKLEPLGGFQDKGRDAIHTDSKGAVTVFAYSVREDWKAKLAEDAAKIKKHGHSCDKMVFLTTASFSASERDRAVDDIAGKYGWVLELYGVERLRSMLEADYPDLRVLHPRIFPPEFFPASQAVRPVKEHIFVSAASADQVFANWLTRKLTADGYKVWYEKSELLGGEVYPDNVDSAIHDKAFCVLGVYSHESLTDPEVMRQRNLALSIAREEKRDFLIPLNLSGVEPHQLDRVTATLTLIPFQTNWAFGLKQLLQKLDAAGCPKLLLTGKSIAASAFLEDDVLADSPETLFSNCLPVEHIPPRILRFEAENDLSSQSIQELKFVWSFRKLSSRVLVSLHHPGSALLNKHRLQRTEALAWANKEQLYDVKTRDLLVELIRKALSVKCHQKGLVYCPDTRLHFFSTNLVPDDRLKFTRPDGSKTYVLATGQRTYWRPSGSQVYKYHLAPVFSVMLWPFDTYTVITQVSVRITDEAGILLQRQIRNSRRKHLCRDWWNREWFNRMLAVCQFLADEQGKISISDSLGEDIILNATPLTMTAPFSINEQVLQQGSFERDEDALPNDDVEDVEADVEGEEIADE